MAITPDEKLGELLEDFDTAMLVTRTPIGQLRSRPMAIADVQPGGHIWFITQRQSGKIDEIESDPHVNIAMQTQTKFLSISGIGEMTKDRQKIDKLWNDMWKTWFPKGKDDPSLALLHVRGDAGEYWDNSGTNGIKYLIEAGKAYLTGTTPDVDDNPKIHGKVQL